MPVAQRGAAPAAGAGRGAAGAPASAPPLPCVRLLDWPIRLSALVEDRLHTPFAWGRSDCCLWAADAVQAVTGVDVAADLRGAWRNRVQAAAVLARAGGMRALCAARLGAEVLPVLAQPGDVGMVDERRPGAAAESPALVVHVGGGWMGQGPDGLVPIDDAAVIAAWRCTAPCRLP